jgi:photosystem II stability/assembly factor-like uncharacterized protein
VNPDRDPMDEKAIDAVRAHFDEEVQEARRRYRAPQLSGRPARGGRGSGRGLPRALGALAVVALAVVVGATVWMVSRNSPVPAGPTTSPTHAVAAVTTASPSLPTPSLATEGTSATPSAAQSAAPNTVAPHYLQGTVGMNGSSAWAMSDVGLSLSQDGGRTWSDVAVPSGVKASSVLAVSSETGRALWLAAGSSNGVLMYRKQGASAWTGPTPLIPSWATISAAGLGGPIQNASITPGPSGLVTVTEVIGLGNFTAAEALFVSTDDGLTFAPHPSRAQSSGPYWSSIVFATAQDGALISGAGTKPHDINYTTDGGATWAGSTVTGLPASSVGDYELGQLVLAGSDIELPVTTFALGSNDYTFLLLVSHDGGANFAPTGAGVPSVGKAFGAFDSLDQVSWAVFDAAAIRESTDGGKTWTTVAAGGLPAGVTSIHLTGATSATAVVAEAGCDSNKTNCYNRTYLVATTDDGQTWVNI